MAECLFCDIATAVAPAEVVTSDEHTVAFLDARPVFSGHVLVVPRKHVETLVDLPHELINPVIDSCTPWVWSAPPTGT